MSVAVKPPLVDRKARLKRLLADAPTSLAYVEHLEGDGRAGLAGSLSKERSVQELTWRTLAKRSSLLRAPARVASRAP